MRAVNGFRERIERIKSNTICSKCCTERIVLLLIRSECSQERITRLYYPFNPFPESADSVLNCLCEYR